MKYNQENQILIKVIALFDEEDIKYIDLDRFKKKNNKTDNKVKVRKIGGNNDRIRDGFIME